MFTKLQLEKYANVMVWALKAARRNGKFKKYDSVLLRTDIAALPLAEQIYQKLLEERLHPILRIQSPEEFSKKFFELADNKQLAFLAPGEKEFQGGINGLIALHAPQDLTYLKQIDPVRIGKSAVARKPIFLDVVQLSYGRTGQAGRAFSQRVCPSNCAGVLFK